ncbi:high affinity choline transporter 1-like isoform X2 [Periophthalmus magnuspinnatus]|uniref:high affinity choline transporter 1-like isoform X2 n=1 Tax=Periophthalmus magnuspinnatus TaxID=409849 RepID=UPI0024367F61|nr:high affinity choline transporter 1-like isoform X2 [Periophthalmus magnuspinnatus]
MNWQGLLSIGVFYIIVLGIGIWASRKSKIEERKCNVRHSEVTIVGGRNLNICVSIFTMTATWVGGGYILGTAGLVYDPTKGLLWAVGPLAFSLNMLIGGTFFITPMRSKNYVTLMDPFQEKYGNTIAAVLFIPALLADLFWVASVLGALGATVSVAMDISFTLSVTISSAVAIIYTVLGGLYSVAYTDVIQLMFMIFGLWFCVPFVLTSTYFNNITESAVKRVYQEPWIGQIKLEDAGCWLDDLMLLAIGGICYQAFYQRVLSAASDAQAKLTCFVGAVLCPILGIPSVLVGAVAASTDWNQTSFGERSPYEQGMAGFILPIALKHLCPFFVSVVGMGALAAAVMSSVDSALLSAASQIARNVYKNIIFKKASERSIVVVIRVSIVLCGLLGTLLAITSTSVVLLWIVSADVLYSVMTPQVFCTLFLSRWVNHYGACSGFVLGLLLRGLVGEPLLGLPSVLPLPWDKTLEDGQIQHVVPFRAAIVIITFATNLLVSQISMRKSAKGFLRTTEARIELKDIKCAEQFEPELEED